MSHKIYVRIVCTVVALLAVWLPAPARDTMTGIFNESVRTLQITGADGDIFVLPAVGLDSDGDALQISFDHISDTEQYLRWRLVRCEADWTPSTISENEWLNGFNESRIEQAEHSDATTVRYVHYSFCFPAPDLRPTLSGNYLIEVYPDDNPDNVWLQARVMVSEQSAPVSIGVTSQTDIDCNGGHQQLSVAVNTDHANVDNPFNDLKVMVSQNSRPDSEVTLRHPLRMSGRTAVYENLPALIFEAGNEYRRFETSNVNHPGMNVADIGYYAPYYHFTLQPDESRAYGAHVYDQTQNGRFMVREYNSASSHVAADYVVVHFTLDADVPAGTRLFLDGDFTQRRFGPESEMVFNRSTDRYEKAMLLKQGHYNYQYLAVPPGAGARAYTAPVEGNYYPTINEYTVKVYARGPMERTDRLIGISRIKSNEN